MRVLVEGIVHWSEKIIGIILVWVDSCLLIIMNWGWSENVEGYRLVACIRVRIGIVVVLGHAELEVKIINT